MCNIISNIFKIFPYIYKLLLRLNKFFSDYQIAQFVQNFVLKVNEPKEILKPDDAKKFIESQQELIDIWENLKNIRNDIAHINNNSNHNIKEELEKFYKKLKKI